MYELDDVLKELLEADGLENHLIRIYENEDETYWNRYEATI